MLAAHRPALPALSRRSRAAVVLAVVGALVVTALVAATFAVGGSMAQAAPIRAFDRVYHEQTNGQIALAGNTVMTCPSSAGTCAAARAGSGSSLNNNDFAMTYVDVDSNAATFNSSAATLAVPEQAEVRFAALVWMGRALDADGTAGLGSRTSMRLQVPGSSTYTTIRSSRTDTTTPGGDTVETVYSSYADVTTLVRSAGPGSYVGADVAAGVGGDRYAGWSLVVAYQDASLPLRDLTIFNGFQQVTSGNPSSTLTLAGLRTPTRGLVRARIGVVAADGDLGLTGDAVEVDGTSVSSDLSPAENFLNSTNDTLGRAVEARSPAYRNNLGWDVKDVPVPGVIPRDATSATVALTTSGEAYLPSILTAAVDLHAPSFASPTTTVANLTGNRSVAAGDTLQYTVAHTNTGDDRATGVVLRSPLPAGLTYVPGSLRITDGTNAGATSDAADADQGEYVAADRLVRVRLGAGADGTTGGALAPARVGAAAATSTVTYRVTVDRAAAGTTIESAALLDYIAPALDARLTLTGNRTSTSVGDLADLTLTGTTSRVVASGSEATYDFDVSNAGPSPATDAVVTATLPAGVTPRSATSGTGATCTIADQSVTCPVDSVAVGASPTVRVVAVAPADLGAPSLSVTGRVTSATSDPDASNDVAVLSQGVGSSADLRITLDGPTGFVPGTERTYRATVTNNGPSDATDVVVTTTLPAGASFDTTSNPSCTSSNGVGVCSIGTLPSGRSVSLTQSVRLTSGFDDPTASVVATVSGSTPDTVSSNNRSVTTASVGGAQADVQITGTATPTTAAAGFTQEFEYTVRNNGPSASRGVEVTVPVPNGTTFVSVVGRGGPCIYAAADRTATCRLLRLPRDSSSAITLTVRVDPATTATLVSVASVVANGNTPGDNDAARVTAPVSVRSDVAVRLTGDNPALSGGQLETYRLGVENFGPASAHDVTFAQTLPAGFAVTTAELGVPAGTTCLVTGSATLTVTCTTSLVASGAAVQVTVPARAPGTLPANVISTAVVGLATPSDDPNHDNDTAEYDLTGATSADVSVTLTASPAPVVAGETLTSVATVDNRGPATAGSVVLTDQLPATLSADSTAVASNGASCTVVDRLVRCALGDLPANETPVTVTISGLVLPGTTGSVSHTAGVAASGRTLDPASSNDSDTARVLVATRADLSVVQTVPATTTAGQSLTWTIAVSNSGPSDAAAVQVRQVLPAGFAVADVAQNAASCTTEGGVVTCVFGTVAAAATRAVTLTASVDAMTSSGTVTLSASGTTTTAQPDTTDDADSDLVSVGRSADLAIAGALAPRPLVAGRRATATFVVTNGGPSVAGAAAVTVPLPAGLSTADVVAVVPSAGTCDAVQSGDTTITCRLGAVVPGVPATVGVTLDVPGEATGTFAVSANLASAEDTTAGNNSATASAPTTADADLAVQILAPETVTAGSGLVYRFVVGNTGPSDAVGTVLSAVLPIGVSPLRIDAPAGVSCVPASPDGRTLRCTVASLGGGDSFTGAVTVTTSPSLEDRTTLATSATVESDTPDANSAEEANAARASTVVRTVAPLAVRTDALPGDVVVPGEPFGYRVAVTSSGPSAAAAVRVVDTLPPGTTATAASTPRGSCAVTEGPDANSVVTCELGTVSAGTVVVSLDGVVLAPGSDADTITNNVLVTSGTAATSGGTTPQRVVSSATTPVRAVADLGITKLASATSLPAGSAIAYTLTVDNPDGPSTSPPAIVTDVVPAVVTSVSVTEPTGVQCTVTPGAGGTTVRCSTGRIDVGDDVAIVVSGRITGMQASGRLTNTASVSVAGDPDTRDSSSTAVVDVVGDADLAVQLAAPRTATPGRALSYDVTVTNNGPSDAAAPTVSIPRPASSADAGVTRADGSAAGCTTTAGTAVCAVPSAGSAVLVAGGSVTLTVTVPLSPGARGTLALSATADSSTADGVPANDSDRATVTLTPEARLTVEKTVRQAATLVAGETAVYEIRVTDHGPSDAAAVVVTDPVPDGLTATAASTDSGGSCTLGATVRCELGTVAAGRTATVLVTVDVARTATGSVTNAATATSPTSSAPATGQVTTGVSPLSLLSVTKTADRDRVTVGEAVRYTITVTNDGRADAPAVVVADRLPTGLRLVSSDPTQGRYDPAAGQWDVGRLDAGASARLVVVATVVGTGTITNVASIDPSTPGTTPDTRPDPAAAEVLGIAPVDTEVTATVRGRRLPVRRAEAAVRIACPSTEASGPCRGVVTLHSLRGPKRVLGTTTWSAAAGRTTIAEVALRRGTVRRLGRSGTRVRIVVRVRDQAGNVAVVRRTGRLVR